MTDEKKYIRFSIFHRIEHWVLVSSFSILGLTGIIQKFPSWKFSEWMITLLGGIESVRIIHRISAVILMIDVIYHLGAILYRLFVNRVRPTMMPSLYDLKSAYQQIRYNFGLKGDKPQQGRYTFQEKFEYWAVVWGTIIMVITGFMLWNPIAVTHWLPGEWIPAAKAAHGAEAVLAILSILIWHFYHVFIKHFNKSMYTGKISEHEMLEEHPLELADIKAGLADIKPSQKEYLRNRKLFLILYGIFAFAAFIGIYKFITLETTSITTIPPAERVLAYAPLAPTPYPSPIPQVKLPTGDLVSWEEGINDYLNQQCGECHGSGPVTLGQFNITDYDLLLTGGSSGPAVVPGDPGSSNLIIIQSLGNHPAQLSAQVIAELKNWILTGAK